MLCQNGIRASYLIFMGFNYYNYRYTNYYEDPLEVKRDMFEDVPVFWVLMIDMDTKIASISLRISFLFWFGNEINCWYAKHRLVGEAFAWWTKNSKYCVTWPRMKIYLRHLPSFHISLPLSSSMLEKSIAVTLPSTSSLSKLLSPLLKFFRKKRESSSAGLQENFSFLS